MCTLRSKAVFGDARIYCKKLQTAVNKQLANTIALKAENLNSNDMCLVYVIQQRT